MVTLACVYAVAGWGFFTGLLIALGDVLLPTISRPVAPVVVLGLTGLTGLAVAGISVDYFRRAQRDDACAGLVLGTTVVSLGLTLDAVLLLSTRFRYPNVESRRMGTLVVVLLLGYAVAAVTPPLAATWRARRRHGPA